MNNTNTLAYTTNLVHLHANKSDRDYCDTECGLRCSDVDTAYRGRDPERVTCPECLGNVALPDPRLPGFTHTKRRNQNR